jgi:hypothetical protein
MSQVLRALIRELKSPVGSSESELLSDVDEVLEVLTGLRDEVDNDTKMKIVSLQNQLRQATNMGSRKISASLANILKFIDGNDKIDAEGLIHRLEALLRRSLPTSGDYDPPQSNLNPPYDPTKTGRYITTV